MSPDFVGYLQFLLCFGEFHVSFEVNQTYHFDLRMEPQTQFTIVGMV